MTRRAPPTFQLPLSPLSPLSPFDMFALPGRLIRKSRPTVRAEVLPQVKCIVVDEVDRLVDVLSKHAPPKEVEKRKRHARPIAALLERVLQSSPGVQVKIRRVSFSFFSSSITSICIHCFASFLLVRNSDTVILGLSCDSGSK